MEVSLLATISFLILSNWALILTANSFCPAAGGVVVFCEKATLALQTPVSFFMIEGKSAYVRCSNGLGVFSFGGFDANHGQEVASFLPTRDERVSIDLHETLLRSVFDMGYWLELVEGVIVDGLVDNLDRNHHADVAVFDLVGVDEASCSIDGQLIVLDVERAFDLSLHNTG
jgi:hypothetical protein